jgi:hypothetical protein
VNKLIRFRRLLPREQRFLVAALIRLPLMALALKFLGFRQLQNILLKFRMSPFLDPGEGVDPAFSDTQTIVKMVGAAVNEGMYRANCLERSLTLWWLLRRVGIASQLKFGVRKEREKLEAHAWLELDGAVLNDDPDVHTDYSPFTGDIAALHAEIQ